MTPESARDKKYWGGQNADCEGRFLLRYSPKFKRPPEIQNWGQFCKMRTYDPCPPLSSCESCRIRERKITNSPHLEGTKTTKNSSDGKGLDVASISLEHGPPESLR